MRAGIISFAVSAAVATLFFAGPAAAQATADDVAWINRCVADNKDEGQTREVLMAYCTCMNNKMSNNETRSITAWEKANPRAMEACSTEAKWKGR